MGRIAIVPARGGSKRIPRKNVRRFRGRPLLSRTIETALDSGVFERVVVSTDDDEIARVATYGGAEVPFIRPEELADDHAATAPVVAHALDELEPGEDDDVCVLYPAAVFLTDEDLRATAERFAADRTLRFLATVTTFAAPVQRALAVDAVGHARMTQPEHLLTRSQDLPERYHDAGQLYWGRVVSWRGNEQAFVDPTGAYVLPRWRVQDIDTEEDWVRAELLHEQLEALAAAPDG